MVRIRDDTDSAKVLIRQAIQRTRLFADLPPLVIDQFCAASHLKTFENGECIAKFGDPPCGILVIAEGSIETSRSKSNGQKLVYDYSQPGQVTGLYSTLDGLGWPLDNHARGLTRIVFIPGELFLSVLREEPALSLGMIDMFIRRGRLDFEHALMSALDPFRVQVAKFLLYFSRGSPSADSQVRVPIRISQDDLAAMLGASRQTVNKELVAFVRDGILAWRHGTVIVLDFAKLLAVAAEEGPLPPDLTRELFERSTEHFRTSD